MVVEWIIMLQFAKSRRWDLVFYVSQKCAKFEINRMSRLRATVTTDFQKPWFEKNAFKTNTFFRQSLFVFVSFVSSVAFLSAISAKKNKFTVLGGKDSIHLKWLYLRCFYSDRFEILYGYSWEVLLSNTKKWKYKKMKKNTPPLINASNWLKSRTVSSNT